MRQRMGLRLVTNDAAPETRPQILTVNHVHAEAKRRLEALDLQRHRDRARARGGDIPRDIRIRELQIMAIALALAGLEPIPDDYRDDSYWSV